MPSIIFRNRGSWEEFVEKFSLEKLVHNSYKPAHALLSSI